MIESMVVQYRNYPKKSTLHSLDIADTYVPRVLPARKCIRWVTEVSLSFR